MRLSLFTVLIAGVAGGAPPSPKPRLLSPAEIFKLMEDSPRQYEIDSEPDAFPQWTQQNAMLAWPELRPALPLPTLETRPDGSRRVAPMLRSEEVAALLEKVEPLFEAKDWAGAEKGYEAILTSFPNEYGVQLDWGDAALFAGKPAIALARYEKATKLNPADHRGWYYLGNALGALGRKKEAIDAWVHAVSMSPANTLMLAGLEGKAPQLGYEMRPRSMLPGARVTPIGDGFKISVDKNRMHWLAWGVCKGLWRGEPSHRKAMTGSEEDHFNILEEKECLASLGTFYERERKEKKIASDPVVERLLAAIKADLITGYLIYEIASRADPHVFLMQTAEVQRQVQDYVRRFVLVPAK